MSADDAPPSDSALLKEALAGVDVHIDASIVQLEKSFLPIVEAEIEFTKTITTLASGALLLSVSITQVIAPRLAHPSVPLLLPAAWVLFGVPIVLAAFRPGWARDARIYRGIIEGARADAHTFIRNRPTKEEMGAFVDKEINAAYEQAGEVSVSNHKWLDRSHRVSAWAFALGMVALITFAIANLPFNAPDVGPRLWPDTSSVRR